ncbi:hypothetical protein MRX96_023232 [Rhipicephalus microplus]
MKNACIRKLAVPSLSRELGFTARTNTSKRHDGSELKWHAIRSSFVNTVLHNLSIDARSTACGLRRVSFRCVELRNYEAHLGFCCTAGEANPADHRMRCSKEFKATDARKARKRGPA